MSALSLEAAKRDLARALRSNDPHRVKAILRSPEADLAWLDRPLERDGGCALHIGTHAGLDTGVHALLEFGCDPNVANQNGETPLHVAAEQRFEHMIDLLVDAEGVRLDAARRLDKRTPLHVAAGHGCVDGVRRLLEAGACIDARDKEGNTPVFLAVLHNRHRVVQELVSQGANLKLKNNGLQTCLAYAMKQSQDKAMIRLLVDRKQHQQQQQQQPVSMVGRYSTRVSRSEKQQQQQQQQPIIAVRQQLHQSQEQQQPPLPTGAGGRVFLTESPLRPVAAGHGVRLHQQQQQLWQLHQPQQQQQAVAAAAPAAGLHGPATQRTPAQAEPVLPEARQRHHYQQQRQSRADDHRKELKSAGVQAGPGHADSGAASSSDDEASNAYAMESKIRGLCIIVNNQDYFNSDDFKERAGTDLDERRLERLFKSLRFHVKIFKNLDAKDIYWNLSNYAKSDHADFDCYVCCILAHGTLGGIYGVDGRVQKLADLTVMLSSTNCPSLAGKPKLFFIQACRGRCLQRGAHFDQRRLPADSHAIQMANHETDALAMDEQQEYILPDHGDFLIGYATVAQHIAQRHREQGSVYVQTLCDVIERGRHKEDLLSLLTKVKYRVSKHVFHNEDGSVFVQMPEVKETLRKKIYFK